MLNIQLLAFGIARDIIGSRTASLELPDDASLQDLRILLLERFPAFAQLRSLAFAVNTDYQTDEYLIRDGDEVVLIPPVSGG
jgi:molybdopterin converting factor subunit 1